MVRFARNKKKYSKILFKNKDDSLIEPDFNNSNFKSNGEKLSASESYGIEGPKQSMK